MKRSSVAVVWKPMRFAMLALAVCSSRLAARPVTFVDDFGGYAEELIGRPWVPLTREWRVHDGLLEATKPERRGTVVWRTDRVFSDVTVDVRFRIVAVGSGVRAPGIVVASSDSEHYYYAHFDSRNSQVILVRYSRGKPWNELARARNIPITPETWHRARLERVGDRLTAYLDDVKVAEAIDGAYRAGVTGLRAGQGHIQFDDLHVTGESANLTDARGRPREWKLMPESIPHDDMDCPRLTDAERVIAVRGQGYFPVLILLDDGSLAAVIRGGAPHIGIEGRLDLIRSTDGGRTWSKPAVVVDSKWDDRNPAFGQMPDGSLVCAYAEAQTYNAEGKWDRSAGEYVLFYVRSEDGGRTWSEKRRLPTGPIRGGSPYGKIVVTEDGTALMSVYGHADPDWKGTPKLPAGARDLVGILRSRDNGKTWGDFSLLSAKDHNETALLWLGGGRILAAARTYSRGNVDILESADGGRTWSQPRPVTEPKQHPADLIRLRDDRLLMTYGNRREPLGCGAMVSSDEGRRWAYNHRVMLGWTSVSGDCGYPSSVQLDDGTIVTMYYSVGLSDVEGSKFAVAVRYSPSMLAR